jgi:alpha-beta hydrolase superfamily lysophospholipase
VVLGHSFGSFLAQEFIKHYGSRISGVILSGSSLMKGADIKAAYFLSRLTMVFGSRKPGRLLNRLSFGSYNKAIKSPSSEFAWLSRDESMVKRYDEDHFCGNVFSNGFYNCFFNGLYRLYDGMDKIPLALPVYILSGEEDPVGKYGSGTKKLYEVYRKLGVTDLRIKLYPGARHEIINEINRAEVYQDILQWLTEHCFTPQRPTA